MENNNIDKVVTEHHGELTIEVIKDYIDALMEDKPEDVKMSYEWKLFDYGQ